MKEYKEIFDLIKSNKVKGICFDSREVEEGFLFIAQKGTNVDGHKFINTAISKGAKYIVCEFIPEDVKELAQKNNEILFIDRAVPPKKVRKKVKNGYKVLELCSGVADKLGLAEGDVLDFK